jgi:calcium/calmodulin-dependent protein kinase I
VSSFFTPKLSFLRTNGRYTDHHQPSYVAPEVLNEDIPYDKRADLWSVGVSTYVLLAGYPPFQDDRVEDLFEQIKRAEYQFHPEYWGEISKDAQDFIRHLIVVDPRQRWSVEDALRSEWMNGLNEEEEGD